MSCPIVLSGGPIWMPLYLNVVVEFVVLPAGGGSGGGMSRSSRARIALAMLVVGLGGLVFGAVAASALAAEGSLGYDVSYPQCNQPFPTGGAFAIVGVNAGLPFSPNPCLGSGDGPSELQWAGPGAQLYANTADPGPLLSSHWPNGQTTPQQCNTASAPGADTVSCAYDYGWNAMQDSYHGAVNAYIAIGLAAAGSTRTPSPNAWWLDVETANSWETNPANNVAALQGAVDYLKSVDAASIGFYAPASDWQTITGGTTQFAAYPSWLPGAASLADAQARCSGVGVNGGPISLVQFPQGALAADTTCAQQPTLAFAGAPQRLSAGTPSGPLVVQLSQAASAPVTVALSSSSASGRFATSATGPWTATLTVVVPAGTIKTPAFYYTDTSARTAVLTASAAGYSATSQTETITGTLCVPPRQHDHGPEIAVARVRSAAAAARLGREVTARIRGLRARVLIERDNCTEYEIAITGFPARPAATDLLQRLRPQFHQATLEPH
jgi:hypothetical protein